MIRHRRSAGRHRLEWAWHRCVKIPTGRHGRPPNDCQAVPTACSPPRRLLITWPEVATALGPEMTWTSRFVQVALQPPSGGPMPPDDAVAAAKKRRRFL